MTLFCTLPSCIPPSSHVMEYPKARGMLFSSWFSCGCLRACGDQVASPFTGSRVGKEVVPMISKGAPPTPACPARSSNA